MGEIIHFTVPMAARGKDRPRFSGGRVHTSEKTKAAEDLVGASASEAMMGRGVFTGPFKVSIVAIYKTPKSWPDWKREHYAAHQLPKTSTPDADNVAKLICDACNGVIWVDDAQVAHIDVDKKYGREDVIQVWAYPLAHSPTRKSEVRI